MTKVLDFESGKQRLEPDRKAAKADALKTRLAASRQGADNSSPEKQRNKATKSLLNLFKSPQNHGR